MKFSTPVSNPVLVVVKGTRVILNDRMLQREKPILGDLDVDAGLVG